MKPGEYIIESGEISANVGRDTATITVYNTGDRPIQVGSHFHFFEANRGLKFERAAAYGMRLNIAAGTAVRFEPGEDKEVSLVALGGSRIMIGCNGVVQGKLDEDSTKAVALQKISDDGYGQI
ncbi:MAG: urease subunit beta [Chloroflexota bacterium]